MSTEFEYYILAIETVIFLIIIIPTIMAFFTGAPWVPTPMPRVKKMLEMANIKPGEKVFDLGCGDGRIPHLAAKQFSADATGFELAPLIYLMARIKNFFLRSKAKFLFRDFRYVDFGKADVLAFYLLPDILKKMKPIFEKQLRPGSRIISYAFEIEGWKPVKVEPRDTKRNYGRIFVYETPISYGHTGKSS